MEGTMRHVRNNHDKVIATLELEANGAYERALSRRNRSFRIRHAAAGSESRFPSQAHACAEVW